MNSLSVYAIILMSLFLALYLPLRRKALVSALPQSARLITLTTWTGSASFIIFAAWLAILKNASASDEALKAPSSTAWIGGVTVVVGLCCVSAFVYFTIRHISKQRESQQLRIKEDQEKLRRLAEELAALGIQLPDEQDHHPTSTK